MSITRPYYRTARELTNGTFSRKIPIHFSNTRTREEVQTPAGVGASNLPYAWAVGFDRVRPVMQSVATVRFGAA